MIDFTSYSALPLKIKLDGKELNLQVRKLGLDLALEMSSLEKREKHLEDELSRIIEIVRKEEPECLTIQSYNNINFELVNEKSKYFDKFDETNKSKLLLIKQHVLAICPDLINYSHIFNDTSDKIALLKNYLMLLAQEKNPDERINETLEEKKTEELNPISDSSEPSLQFANTAS